MHAGVSGFLPERLREDMTWNRVANIHGIQGKNIGLDLLNEFINNEFKGQVTLLNYEVRRKMEVLLGRGE